MKRTIILDTDIGGDIDDTWAICTLLRCPELDLRAITTVTGDTLYRARLCAKLLRSAGHPAVPIGLGKRVPDVYTWQSSWLDTGINSEDDKCLRPDAAQLIIETVRGSKEPITLICIGPLTNIAEMLSRAPELTAKIDLLVMGGSIYHQYLGQSGHCPEYNIEADIPAAQAVFQASWHSFWLTPLDTCGNIFIRGELYQQLLRSELPLPQALIANYRAWCTARKEKINPNETSSMIADVAAVIQAVNPEMTYNSYLRISVNDKGETIIDENNGKLVLVAVEWKDVEAFYNMTVSRLLTP